MKLKKCLAICSAFFMFGSGVFAEGNKVFPTYNNNVLTIKIKTDSKEGTVASVSVLKKGDENSVRNLYAIKEVVIGNGGYADIVFEMPETRDGEKTDGEYILYVKETGRDTKSYEFNFVTPETKEELARILEEADAAKITELLSVDSAYRNAFVAQGFSFDIYDSLTQNIKSDISESMSDSDDKSVYMLKKIVAEEALGEGNPEEVLDMVNPGYKDTFFSQITDEKLKSFIVKYFANESDEITAENMEKQYAVSNVLYILNNARYNEIEDIMKENEEILELGGTAYDDYSDLSASKRKDVCEDIARALKKTPAENIDDFADVIEASMPEEKKSSSSGGSGGGGGGSVSKTSNAIVTTVTPVESEKPAEDEKKEIFTDMENAKWAVTAVESLYEKGIVSGVGDGEFQPSRNITREEFITMLVKAMGIAPGGETVFSDVLSDSWYEPYVNAAYHSGITKGVNDTEFGIGNLITRQDMMTMISRVMPVNNEKVRSIGEITDINDISDYAFDAVINLYEAGLVSGMGDGRISPKSNATRAEASQMLYNMLNR